MRRRAFLASSGSLLGSALAGCVDFAGSREADRGPGASEVRASAASAAVSLSVRVERLQPAVVGLSDAGATIIGAHQQYLFYHVDVTGGEPPDRLDFAFRLGGRMHSPGVSTAGRIWRETQSGNRYSAVSGSGWLVFELPDRWSARHAALSLGGREWPVGRDLRNRIAEPSPPLSVAWDVSATSDPGRTVHEFRAGNESDRDTWFVGALTASGALSPSGPLAVFNRRVRAGEREAWNAVVEGLPADSPTVGDGDSDVTYRLLWAGGKRERRVRFAAPDGSA